MGLGQPLAAARRMGPGPGHILLPWERDEEESKRPTEKKRKEVNEGNAETTEEEKRENEKKGEIEKDNEKEIGIQGQEGRKREKQ